MPEIGDFHTEYYGTLPGSSRGESAGWSGSAMMIDRLKETGRHTLVFGIGFGLQSAFNFILLPVYTRYLTPEEYGALNLLMVAGALLMLFSSAVIPPALFRSYYDYDREKKRTEVVSTALGLSTILASLLLVVGFIFRQPTARLLTGNSEYGVLLGLIMLNSFFMSICSLGMAVFRAQKNSGKYLAVSTIAMCTSFLVTIYLVIFKKLGMTGVVIGILASNAIAAPIYLWLIRRNIRPIFSMVEARKMLFYGSPLIPANLLGFMENYVSLLIIQLLLGSSAVGLFALARRLGQIVKVAFLDPLDMILPATIFSAEKDPRAKEFYARLLTYLLLISVFIAMTVAAFRREILRIMTQPTFWGAEALVPWMCLAAVLYGARYISSAGLSLKRKTIWFPIARAVSTGLYFGLMFVLVPHWGITGAAIALVVGYAAGTFIRTIISQKFYYIPFEGLRIIKILLSSAICMTFTICIDDLKLSLSHAITAKFLACFFFYPILLVLFHFPDHVEVKAIRNRLRITDR